MMGEFEVVVEDADGNVMLKVSRWADGHLPRVGEEFVFQGEVYEVCRVQHRDPTEESRTVRVYTMSVCYIRPRRPRGVTRTG
jgi:hypothetical protein